MDSLATYFQMGGYAWFVWPAYLITATVMTGLVVFSLGALRRDRKILKALEAANPRRARSPVGAEGQPAPAAEPEEAASDA